MVRTKHTGHPVPKRRSSRLMKKTGLSKKPKSQGNSVPVEIPSENDSSPINTPTRSPSASAREIQNPDSNVGEDSPNIQEEASESGTKEADGEPELSASSSVERTTADQSDHGVSPGSESHPASKYDFSKPYSVFYLTKSCSSIFRFMQKRPLLSERTVLLDSFTSSGIVDLLITAGLDKSLTMFKPFVSRLVYEFYANLQKDIGKEGSTGCHRVYVRNRTLTFSPSQINTVLKCPSFDIDDLATLTDMDLVASELVGTEMLWPRKSGFLVTATLQLKYKALHKIAVHNWWPTEHTTSVSVDLAKLLFVIGTGLRFDFGKHVFDIVTRTVTSQRTTQCLPFPSTIFCVLMAQANLCDATEYHTPLQRPLTLSTRLLVPPTAASVKGECGSRVPASTEPSSTVTGSTSVPLTVLKSLQDSQKRLEEGQ